MRWSTALVVCAACSPVKGELVDAHAVPDVPTVDAAMHGVVTVTVLDPQGTGAPAVGVPVVFLDPSGMVVAHPNTDTNGKASQDVLIGSTVVVVETLSASSFEMITLLAVAPGDNLLVGRPAVDSSSAGNFTVNYSAFPNAQQYLIETTCGSTSSPMTLPVTFTNFAKACTANPMEVAVIAEDNASNVLGSVGMTGVVFTSGGNVTMPSMYTFPNQLQISYTNMSNVARLQSQRIGPTQNFSVFKSSSPTGQQLAVSMTVPASGTALMSTRVNNVANAQQTVQQPLGGAATTYGLDLDTTLLPWFGLPTLDVATGEVAVPIASSGTSNKSPSMFLLEVAYNRTIAGVSTSFQWLVAGPTPGNVTLPKVPTVVGDVNPKAGDVPSFLVTGAILSDALTGYDQARKDIFSVLGQPPATAKTVTSVSPFVGG
jgi:hypothetical protein